MEKSENVSKGFFYFANASPTFFFPTTVGENEEFKNSNPMYV